MTPLRYASLRFNNATYEADAKTLCGDDGRVGVVPEGWLRTSRPRLPHPPPLPIPTLKDYNESRLNLIAPPVF